MMVIAGQIIIFHIYTFLAGGNWNSELGTNGLGIQLERMVDFGLSPEQFMSCYLCRNTHDISEHAGKEVHLNTIGLKLCMLLGRNLSALVCSTLIEHSVKLLFVSSTCLYLSLMTFNALWLYEFTKFPYLHPLHKLCSGFNLPPSSCSASSRSWSTILRHCCM